MQEAEFIVVGGGVYGAAFAHELVVRGSSVTLLEAGALAQRASGGPGKRGVRANARHSTELPLAREALTLWPGLSARLDGDTGFELLGGMMLVGSMPEVGEIGLARAAAHQRLQLAHGIDTELLDRTELDALEPGLGGAEIAALFCAHEGIADQGATARSYAAAAVRLGALVRECSPVREVGSSPRPYVVLEDGSRLEAGRAVVLAANHGTDRLISRSHLPRLPMWTMAPQALMVRAKDGYQPRHLAGHLQKTLSVKALADGITMISGGMRGRWDVESSSGQPVGAMVNESLDIAASVFPQLAGGELVAADASVPETFTPDGLPYIDFLDDQQGLLVATGWSGHGFAIAPAVAQHVADWLTTGHKPALLAPFGILRP
jgi:sarcosine oxidase subunit beta